MRKQIPIETVTITESKPGEPVHTKGPLAPVLRAFGLPDNTTMVRYGSGLINDTWKLSYGSEAFILQRINDAVFKDPASIAFNVRSIAGYLTRYYPDYPFVKPLASAGGSDLVNQPGLGYFRLLPFIPGSHTVDVATTPSQAFEAARQFGRFTRSLSHFDASSLKITLPDFHNLKLRYKQFTASLESGLSARIAEMHETIGYLTKQRTILDEFQRLQRNVLIQRVTHHDTKISNVLFDEAGKGTHVIDLDTVMPGYFISDIGDMMRTCLSPASEEEPDFSLVTIRTDFFRALKQGYLSEMDQVLSPEEQKLFVFAGKFMIYMQALRFLTDYLLGDVYYATKYEGQNRVRAGNQAVLLQALYEKEAELESA